MALDSRKMSGFARAFAQSLKQMKNPGDQSAIDSSFQAVENYERLASEVYRLRQNGSQDDPAVLDAEDLLTNSAQDLVQAGDVELKSEPAYTTFIRQYRQAWRDHMSLFLFTTCLFIASMFLGWNIGMHQPDYLTLFVNHEFLEMIHDHESWFERLQQNPIMGAYSIAVNNMKVAFLGFVLGAAFGIGGIYILIYNGVFLGAILGYCYKHDFGEQLTTFVVTHGPLEMTLIVAACFAGLVFGRIFFQRPYSTLKVRLIEARGQAAVLALGIIPWLILAAIFEGFVSPFPIVPVEIKIFLGLAISVIFWVWTFGKIPPDPDQTI